MSNVLIIKHGSLGDLVQANGAIADIRNSFNNSKILLLTSMAYIDFMSRCPNLDGVLIDKRLPRWNLYYLLKLKSLLKKYNFTHVFDLQNSRRTYFYRKFILKNSIWSSTETSLEKGEKKRDFDTSPVLDRMEIQLKKSGIKTTNVKNIDLRWSFVDISKILKRYTLGDFILIFPFCSKKHPQKKWPYFKELVLELKKIYNNKYPILIAPGPNEIDEAKNLNAKIVLDNDKPLSINQLITLINKSKFIVANDTGPAHISSHLNKEGVVLFGQHTTAKQVSIGNKNFEVISEKNLEDLNIKHVIQKISKKLN